MHYRKLPRKGPSLVLKIIAPKVGHKAWQIITFGLNFFLSISSLTRSTSCIVQGRTSLFFFPLSNTLFEPFFLGGGGRGSGWSVQTFLPTTVVKTCWHDQKFIPFVPPPLLNVELPNLLRWRSLSMKVSTLKWGRVVDKNA